MKLKTCTLAVSTALLAACGGGGDNGNTNSNVSGGQAATVGFNPSGLWNGTVDGLPANVIITEDKEVYMGDANTIGISRSLSVTQNNFSASKVHFLTIEGGGASREGTVIGTFTERQTLILKAINGGGDAPFTFDKAYDTPAPVPAATYSGSTSGARKIGDVTLIGNITLTVNPDNTVTGKADGCSFTGTLSPTPKFYSKAIVKFGNENACMFPGQSFGGIGFLVGGKATFLIGDGAGIFRASIPKTIAPIPQPAPIVTPPLTQPAPIVTPPLTQPAPVSTPTRPTTPAPTTPAPTTPAPTTPAPTTPVVTTPPPTTPTNPPVVVTPPPSSVNICQYIAGSRIVAGDNTYLGSLTNKFSSDSVMNEFGNYGSQYSSTSIWNQFGNYGSQFGTYSAFNQFSTMPPHIIKNGVVIGSLTTNTMITGWLHPNTLKTCNFF